MIPVPVAPRYGKPPSGITEEVVIVRVLQDAERYAPRTPALELAIMRLLWHEQAFVESIWIANSARTGASRILRAKVFVGNVEQYTQVAATFEYDLDHLLGIVSPYEAFKAAFVTDATQLVSVDVEGRTFEEHISLHFPYHSDPFESGWTDLALKVLEIVWAECMAGERDKSLATLQTRQDLKQRFMQLALTWMQDPELRLGYQREPSKVNVQLKSPAGRPFTLTIEGWTRTSQWGHLPVWVATRAQIRIMRRDGMSLDSPPMMVDAPAKQGAFAGAINQLLLQPTTP
jgi:hypothetical protein